MKEKVVLVLFFIIIIIFWNDRWCFIVLLIWIKLYKWCNRNKIVCQPYLIWSWGASLAKACATLLHELLVKEKLRKWNRIPQSQISSTKTPIGARHRNPPFIKPKNSWQPTSTSTFSIPTSLANWSAQEEHELELAKNLVLLNGVNTWYLIYSSIILQG